MTSGGRSPRSADWSSLPEIDASIASSLSMESSEAELGRGRLEPVWSRAGSLHFPREGGILNLRHREVKRRSYAIDSNRFFDQRSQLRSYFGLDPKPRLPRGPSLIEQHPQ